jgi:ankyrin repeat protein
VITNASCLHSGAAHDQVDTVRYFLGVRPGLLREARDTRGHTVLHIAAAMGAANVARMLLLNYRTNPGIRTRDGKTAYWLAKENNHANVLRVFEDFGPVRGRRHGW